MRILNYFNYFFVWIELQEAGTGKCYEKIIDRYYHFIF